MIMRLVLVAVLAAVSVVAAPLDEAKGLIEAKSFEEARPLLEKAYKIAANEAEAALLLTQVCNELGDWKAGVTYGKRAVKLLPDNPDAHYQYAVALRQKMTNSGKMKAMFTIGTYKDELEIVLKLDPKNADALAEQIGFLTNAPGVAGGDLDEAEEGLARLEKLDWLLAKQMQLGIEMKREDTLAAKNVTKEILKRYPNESSTHATYGYLLQQDNKFEEADEQFAQLLEDDDHQIAMTALYQRGRTRVLGKYELEEAILMFESYLLKLDDDSPGLPSEAGALWRIGMAYELLGQIENARTAYKKAIKLEPDFKEAKKALKKLK